MLQLNFLRNHFLTVRALQRWSRLLSEWSPPHFGGREWQWYSCRNWVTICQGCYSNENSVYIIEHHKGFIFILSAISVELTVCWHKITKLKWRTLNHFRSDSTKCVKVVPKHRYMKTPVELVIRTDFGVPLNLISLLHVIVLAIFSFAASPFPSLLDSLPSSSYKHVTPIFKKCLQLIPHLSLTTTKILFFLLKKNVFPAALLHLACENTHIKDISNLHVAKYMVNSQSSFELILQ